MAVITELLESQHLIHGIAVALALVFASHFFRELADGFPYRDIPIIGRSKWELSNSKAKKRFVSSAKDLIAQGFSQGRTVFQTMFAHNMMIVLHPNYINEIKNHPHLDFSEANKKAFMSHIPGFEPFGGSNQDSIMAEMVNKKLTQTLGQLTIPLSRETAVMFKEILPQSDEWKPFTFAQEIPHIVARLSTMVFLGDKICRDKTWLDVSVNYTIDAFVAARDIRLWPSILRPLVHWFIPSARRVRKHIAIAKEIVQKEIKKRELIEQGKLPEEDPPRAHTDSLDWFKDVINGRSFNQTQAQIGLSLAAIHTTSNLLTNVMYDLIAYPEYIQPLRDEIKAVIEEDGMLKKTSLTKMKKMDSVMKESQRTHPVSITFLHRLATHKVVLSDGTTIPKGASVTVSAHNMEDESLYPSAKTFDGLRHYNKRQTPGNEHRFQFVSTSPEHLGFGHGVHACPGRFFAANEVKILLAHLLMKYDWKFAEGQGEARPQSIMHGTEIICDPTVELRFRARQPEIDLAGFDFGEGMDE